MERVNIDKRLLTAEKAVNGFNNMRKSAVIVRLNEDKYKESHRVLEKVVASFEVGSNSEFTLENTHSEYIYYFGYYRTLYIRIGGSIFSDVKKLLIINNANGDVVMNDDISSETCFNGTMDYINSRAAGKLKLRNKSTV